LTTHLPETPAHRSSLHADDPLHRIESLDRRLTVAMTRASNTLREALDDIEPAYTGISADMPDRALDEHRAFWCKVVLARFIALHLSSRLTPEQMMWWTR